MADQFTGQSFFLPLSKQSSRYTFPRPIDLPGQIPWYLLSFLLDLISKKNRLVTWKRPTYCLKERAYSV